MDGTGSERLDQMQDPELSIEQVMTDYRRLGYSESWINQRIKSIDIIYKTWSDHTAKEFKDSLIDALSQFKKKSALPSS